jgi:Flp pilus assembly protein TadB
VILAFVRTRLPRCALSGDPERGMMSAVPLSEDEQRILRQIEQQLEQDPTFAARGYRVPRHRVALLAVGLIAALTITVLGLAVSFWLAFAGFLVVLFVAVSLEREVRLLARERLGSLPISAWLGGGRRGGSSRHEPAD